MCEPYRATMTDRLPRLLLLALAAASMTSPLTVADDPPAPIRGIVFILADDLRADFLGCTGRKNIETPAIDRLAASGTRFEHAYCQGSRSPAVCLPSRSRILTGGSDWSVPNWPAAQRGNDLPLWPDVLRDLGWRTHHVGKWHCGRPWFERSFESGESVLFGGMGSHWTLEVEDHPLVGDPAKRRLRRYSTEEFGGAAVDFLRSHAADEPDRPFVLSLCFTAPHDPRTSPEESEAETRAATIGLPGNLLPVHPFDNGEMTIRDEELLPWPRTTTAVRREIALYEQMIEAIDRQVAAVLSALDQTGLRDEVLVIFAGDHGLALGSHGLLGKQNLYEHSMRAPLILDGAAFSNGGVRRDFAHLHDLAPTILAAAGVSPPDRMDGQDLHRPTGRDGVLTRYRDAQRAWRGDRFKIIWYPAIDRWQVFDLSIDPEEIVDLARDPGEADRIAVLRRELQAARDRCGDDAILLVEETRSETFDAEAANAARSAKRPHWRLR